MAAFRLTSKCISAASALTVSQRALLALSNTPFRLSIFGLALPTLCGGSATKWTNNSMKMGICHLELYKAPYLM